MRCRQAGKRLAQYHWQYDACSQDKELMEHLKICSHCQSLVQAEETLQNDFNIMQQAEPPEDLSLNVIREKAENSTNPAYYKKAEVSNKFADIFKINPRYKIAAGFVVVLLAFLALVPFNFREMVGYEVSISGVDRSIAMDNREIISLLDALGMDKDKAAILMDSLERKEIHLYVGECLETCHLKISDIKTEKDVEIVVNAIIELGCCEIDKIMPIFKNESTSLIGHATKKLLS